MHPFLSCVFLNAKYLYRLRTIHVTLAHHFVVFIPTFVHSFIHLFANDELVLCCSALMDGPCFRTFYRRLELRYRPNGNRVKTDRSIDPVLNDVTSRLAIYSDPVFEFFRNDSRILKRLTRWERNDKLAKYDRI